MEAMHARRSACCPDGGSTFLKEHPNIAHTAADGFLLLLYSSSHSRFSWTLHLRPCARNFSHGRNTFHAGSKPLNNCTKSWETRSRSQENVKNYKNKNTSLEFQLGFYIFYSQKALILLVLDFVRPSVPTVRLVGSADVKHSDGNAGDVFQHFQAHHLKSAERKMWTHQGNLI